MEINGHGNRHTGPLKTYRTGKVFLHETNMPLQNLRTILKNFDKSVIMDAPYIISNKPAG